MRYFHTVTSSIPSAAHDHEVGVDIEPGTYDSGRIAILLGRFQQQRSGYVDRYANQGGIAEKKNAEMHWRKIVLGCNGAWQKIWTLKTVLLENRYPECS